MAGRNCRSSAGFVSLRRRAIVSWGDDVPSVLTNRLYAVFGQGTRTIYLPMPRTIVSVARLLAPLLLFLLCESIATAQRDLRLSPPRRRAVIQPDALVQSAARIGARTLVAWGTSDWSADSSTYNLLRMQMLEDTSFLGAQRPAGSADARPFGYVQVIALDDRFLILWNDRRAGDSAAYARVV